MQEMSGTTTGFKTGVMKPWYTEFHHAIGQEEFVGQRPTVVLLVIREDAVLLVQPAKDPERRTWIPPQGGITWMDALIQAIHRRAGVELQLPEERIVKQKMRVLGEYVNPIPLERGQKFSQKLLIFIAVPIWGRPEIVLNGENRNHAWVKSPDYLETLMADTREKKREAVRAATNEAHRHGLLSWSCRQQNELVRQAA